MPSKVSYLEITRIRCRLWRIKMGDRWWSGAGTRFDEMFATLLPVGSWLPTAAMEQADRKSLGPESSPCRPSSRNSYGSNSEPMALVTDRFGQRSGLGCVVDRFSYDITCEQVSLL